MRREAMENTVSETEAHKFTSFVLTKSMKFTGYSYQI
jgi:hypothetical protein